MGLLDIIPLIKRPQSALDKRDVLKLVDREFPVIFEIGCADGLDTEGFLKSIKIKVVLF